MRTPWIACSWRSQTRKVASDRHEEMRLAPRLRRDRRRSPGISLVIPRISPEKTWLFLLQCTTGEVQCCEHVSFL